MHDTPRVMPPFPAEIELAAGTAIELRPQLNQPTHLGGTTLHAYVNGIFVA